MSPESARAESAVPAEPVVVPLEEVESALSRLLHPGGAGVPPVSRARMSNLVIFCSESATVDDLQETIPGIVAIHPARVLLLIGEPGTENGDVSATVHAWYHDGGTLKVGSEQVTLRARGHAVSRLPYCVRSFLIGDLPTNIWWASRQPPGLAGPFLFDLAERAQQIIYDSNGWIDPARGVAATAAWLAKLEVQPNYGRRRVVADLNWRRLKYWRRLISQALDPATAPGALSSVSELLVQHGPHAVIPAWELVSWLTSRLGWRVGKGHVEPGVEISWSFQTPQGIAKVRLRRQADGPSAVQHVRIACQLNGRPGSFNFVLRDDLHLAVVPEGIDASPRTLTIQRPSLAELIGRQLSDRERDPVFSESMAVAQILSQSAS